MNRRFGAGAAVGTVLVLSLTGCLDESKSGKSSGSPGGTVQLTAAQVLQKTSQKTSQAQSYTADIAFQGTDQGQAVKARGNMRYQAQPPAFSMTFTSLSGGGMNMPGGMQMIVINNTMYMKIPFLTQMTGGKPWMKFSERDFKKGDAEELKQQGDQFNTQLLTKMFTTSKDAKMVGKETVDGVQTTHYTGTFTEKDALNALSPDERKAAKDFLDVGTDALAFDLWIDDQQLPRKVVMKSVPGAKEKESMTMVFHDYGKPVTITPPPAEQTGRPPKEMTVG
jgi:hypothetical protein